MTTESSSSHRYPSVEPQPSFPALEREILSFWDGDHTFEASVAARDGADEYVFYDGPPFANGLPHYGHLLTGYVKDVVPTLPKDQAFFDDYSKPETLRKMQSLNRHDAWFANFMKTGPHVAVQSHLMRDQAVPQGLEWFDKLPFDTQATPAHQDGYYWNRTPDIAGGIWIALDPVDGHVIDPFEGQKDLAGRVIRAVGKLGEPKNVEQLLPFLSRPEKELRIEAIQALARSGLADATALALLADRVIERDN